MFCGDLSKPGVSGREFAAFWCGYFISRPVMSPAIFPRLKRLVFLLGGWVKGGGESKLFKMITQVVLRVCS